MDDTNNSTPLPLEAIYDAEINPLMARILDICKQHKIAMLASFSLGDDPTKGPLHCTSALLDDEYSPPTEYSAALDCLVPPQKSSPLLKLTLNHADGTQKIAVITG